MPPPLHRFIWWSSEKKWTSFPCFWNTVFESGGGDVDMIRVKKKSGLSPVHVILIGIWQFLFLFYLCKSVYSQEARKVYLIFNCLHKLTMGCSLPSFVVAIIICCLKLIVLKGQMISFASTSIIPVLNIEYNTETSPCLSLLTHPIYDTCTNTQWSEQVEEY